MTTRSLFLGSALLLAGLGCRDDIQSPLEAGPGALPAGPELAVVSNSWTSRRDLWSNQYSKFATAMVPNAAGQSILYVIGGATATGASLSKVMAYDVATNRWTVKAPLPEYLRSTNGAGVINGKIYVSGGQFGYISYSNQLHVYDPAANAWSRKRDMPAEGFDGVTGVIDDKLYVVTSCHFQDEWCGGPDRGLFRYDPPADTWTELALPPQPFGAGTEARGGTIGRKLYVAESGSSELQIYDPTSDTWTVRTTTRVARRGAAFATLGAKLYMIGGIRTNADGSTSPVRATHVYDPVTNLWAAKAQLPTARAGMAATRVFVNGRARLELVGGTRPGNNLQYIP